MAWLSNGIISDENLRKRPTENGACSSSGPPPKWKRRKVSAVRDFPPGCGPNALPMNVIPQEANGFESVPHKGAKSLENAGVENATDAKLVGSEKGSENNAMRLSEELHKVEVEMMTKKDLLEGDIRGSVIEQECRAEVQALAKEEVDGVEVQAMKAVSGMENETELEIGSLASAVVQVGDARLLSSPKGPITNGNIEQGSSPKSKYRRRKVSAVRDFPPFCGWNAPDPTEADRLRINGNKSFGAKDNGGEGIERLPDAVVLGDESSKGNVQNGEVQKSESDELRKELHPEMRSNDKGLVSKDLSGDKGGLIIERLAEAMVADGEESALSFLDEEVKESEPEVIGSEPANKLHGVIQERDEDVRGKAGREIVVYSRDKLFKKRTSDDTGGLSGEESEVNVRDETVMKSKAEDISPEPAKKISSVIEKCDKDFNGQLHKAVRENPLKRMPLGDDGDLGCKMEDRVIVRGLMASPYCPWKQGNEGITGPDNVSKRSNIKRHAFTTKKSIERKAAYGGKLEKGKSIAASKAADRGALDMVVWNEEDSIAHIKEQTEEYPAIPGPHRLDVTVPPFGPKSSNDTRNQVRETLRLFQALCRKLLQGEEAKSSHQGKNLKRIDLEAAKFIKKKGKLVNTGQILGAVPGVEVGDEFQYRVELAMVGVHRLYQAGIDYMKNGEDIVAISIVASGGYDDELDNPDCLIYSGSGGIGKKKQYEDQKLERGNLALKNSIMLKNSVRVIRGSKETKASVSLDAKAKTYVYDGLYTVERYWQDPGPHGKLVFKFELRRNAGQPELAWKEVKKSKKFKTREGRCVDDISGGKELFPICAVNTIDNEKPPPFTYITRMIYPDWYRPMPPKGCDCSGACSDKRCSCAFKNGGEIPYNHNGAIVEAKPLVYECGPSCKCPPSCYNRVTQHGIKIQLEIFKTESRGWGVRSLSSISSGSFICEYIGELLEDTEAEKRISNDEYLFDIGKNYTDCSLNANATSSSEVVEDGGFTIDAATCGNVGRFINHSCSPNLYAQNVLYDQEDKRMPHIMLFAAENIPPLQELTYHYNYQVDAVRDPNGNIKIKRCYCGSTECTGRMY